MSDYETDFMDVEVERDTTEWYSTFTEYWTCSVAVDAEKPAGEVRYSVRVVGPNGEACKNVQIEPEDVPRDVRAKFEEMFRDAAKVA